jgi:hypothetical protein
VNGLRRLCRLLRLSAVVGHQDSCVIVSLGVFMFSERSSVHMFKTVGFSVVLGLGVVYLVVSAVQSKVQSSAGTKVINPWGTHPRVK